MKPRHDRRLDESFLRCAEITRTSGSNFVRCFFLLPKKKRLAMEVLYAFLRVTDDMADEMNVPAELRRAKLLRWRERLESLDASRSESSREFHGEPFHEVSDGLSLPVEIFPALAYVMRHYPLDTAYLSAVIEGCVADCAESIRRETLDAACAYCDRVAGAVGLATLAIFGTQRPLDDPEIQGRALACGRAFQWTNFLRDIAEDVPNRRLYFPQEDFVAAGLDPSEWHNLIAGGEKNAQKITDRLRLPNDPLTKFLAIEFARTELYYAEARPLSALVADDARRVFDLMFGVYETLFHKIRKNPVPIFYRRVRWSLWERGAFFLRLFFTTRR